MRQQIPKATITPRLVIIHQFKVIGRRVAALLSFILACIYRRTTEITQDSQFSSSLFSISVYLCTFLLHTRKMTFFQTRKLICAIEYACRLCHEKGEPTYMYTKPVRVLRPG